MNRTCRDYERLLTLHLAGDLAEGAEKRLRAHLEKCPDCRAALAEQEPLFTDIHHSLTAAPDEAPLRLSPDRRRRILNAARRAAARRPSFADRLARWLDFGVPAPVRVLVPSVLIFLVVIGMMGLFLPATQVARERGRAARDVSFESILVTDDTVKLEKLEDLRTDGYMLYSSGEHADNGGVVNELAVAPPPPAEMEPPAIDGIAAGNGSANRESPQVYYRNLPSYKKNSESEINGRKSGDKDGDEEITVTLEAPTLETKSPIVFKGLWGGRARAGRGDSITADAESAPAADGPAAPAAGPAPAQTPAPTTISGGVLTDSDGAGDRWEDKSRGLAAAAPRPPPPPPAVNKPAAPASKAGSASSVPGWHEPVPAEPAPARKQAEERTKELAVLRAEEGTVRYEQSTLSVRLKRSDGPDKSDKSEGSEKKKLSGQPVTAGGKLGRDMVSESAVNTITSRAYGVNPYVAALNQPFSTFAIDVDTASYTLARNQLLQGRLPPPESVRTEEIVNYFDYHYSAPPADAMFAVHSLCAPSPLRPGQQMLRIGVKARALGREENRPAVLTFAIDTSGSMSSPDRLGLVQRALRLLVERLSPGDRVAIIQFDTKARLVLDYTPAADKARLLQAIDALQTSGSTNLEEGMRLAYACARRAFVPGAANRVLILSDGAANLGAASAEEILAVVADSRRQGIFCSVYGVGRGGLNDALLETLANKGDGAYVYLDSLEEARRVFVDELAATLNTVAADVKIQVEFNPARVELYRQLGYENRQLRKEDFRNDAVDAGEVGSGQSVTALYDLRGLVPGSRGPLGVVRLRYRDLRTGRFEESSAPLPESMLKASFEQAEPAFQLAVLAAHWSEALRGSPYAEGDDPAELTALLRRTALHYALDGRVQELVRLADESARLSRSSR